MPELPEGWEETVSMYGPSFVRKRRSDRPLFVFNHGWLKRPWAAFVGTESLRDSLGRNKTFGSARAAMLALNEKYPEVEGDGKTT